MLIALPVGWVVVIDIAAWLVLHLGLAWAGTQLPERLFEPGQWWCRERAWERDGRLYATVFGVRRWKRLLPDGAALFKGGFPKSRLRAGDPAYLARFARETCRGEAVHWAVLASSGLFFIWNPWWAGLIMVVYGLAANVPCILTQRYNRIRLLRLAARDDIQRYARG